jgi:hypothetical protein
MSNKFITGLACSASIMLSLSCGGSKHSKAPATLPGTWQSTPIVIDGDSKDWPSPYPNYDARGRVGYATSNDGRNLYITMETGDDMTQLKILKQGMTILIDTNGKKEGKFKINFPLLNDIDEVNMPRREGGKNQSQFHPAGMWAASINKVAKDANQFSLEGFANCNGGYVVTQTTSCGIKVMLRIDEYKELVWEAVVPFKAIYGKDTITAADAGRPISVCFAVNKFKHPEKASADNSAGTSGNGTGMGNSGGMGGGARGGRGAGKSPGEDPMQHLYENTKTWKQFGIAYLR